MIYLPIEIGDVILAGRFKNKKITVKEITYDENGLPLINGRGILKIRIQKLMKPKQNTIKEIIQRVISEANLTDRPELEPEARRYAELANKMKELEAQLEEMSAEYEGLDNKFRTELEAIGKAKDTFIRAGKILIKIERSQYDKKNKSYKTGWEYLYPRVQGSMKKVADEAMKMVETTSTVKSKISVVYNENRLNENKFTDLIKKFGGWLKNQTNKLLNLTNQANSELDKLEKLV